MGQQSLGCFDEAIADVYRLSLLGNWQYVCTLSSDVRVSADIQERLVHLERAKALIEQVGRCAEHYRVDEIEDEAFSL